jgi:uncharacterized protein
MSIGLPSLAGPVCAIALVAGTLPLQAAPYAPLGCSRAATPSEQTICGSYALGQLEARMATLYAVATSLVAMGQRGDLEDSQRTWLERRSACGADPDCLANAYRSRIDALEVVIAGIASRGPY